MAPMITNGSEAFRSQLGHARGTIARARRAGAAPPLPDPRSAQEALPEDTLSVVR